MKLSNLTHVYKSRTTHRAKHSNFSPSLSLAFLLIVLTLNFFSRKMFSILNLLKYCVLIASLPASFAQGVSTATVIIRNNDNTLCLTDGAIAVMCVHCDIKAIVDLLLTCFSLGPFAPAQPIRLGR